MNYNVGDSVYLGSTGCALYLERTEGMFRRSTRRIYIGTVAPKKTSVEVEFTPAWMEFRQGRLGLDPDETFDLIKPNATSVSEEGLVQMLDDRVDISGSTVRVGDHITAFNLYKWWRTVATEHAVVAIVNQVVQPGPNTPGGAVVTYSLKSGSRETRFLPSSMFSTEKPPVYRSFFNPIPTEKTSVEPIRDGHPLLKGSLAVTVEERGDSQGEGSEEGERGSSSY